MCFLHDFRCLDQRRREAQHHGFQSCHFYHGRTGHAPLPSGTGAEEQSGSSSTRVAAAEHGACSGAGAALRGHHQAPQRGRPVPHLPQLPGGDQRHRNVPEPGQPDGGGHHHLRPQGLGVRGAQEVHVLQPHRRPAQDDASVPRVPQVLLAVAVQEPEHAQPGEHLRRLAVHAQSHRQHGQHLRGVQVVQAQDRQQRVRHRPRRDLRAQQGAPAHADLQQGPAARACARAGAGARGVRRSQPGGQQGRRAIRQQRLERRALQRRHQRRELLDASCCRVLDDHVVR
jgi:hypothetical protein